LNKYFQKNFYKDSRTPKPLECRALFFNLPIGKFSNNAPPGIGLTLTAYRLKTIFFTFAVFK